MPFSQGALKVANPSENVKNVPERTPHHHVFLRYELHLFLQMTLQLYRRRATGGADHIFKLNKSAATVEFILWLKKYSRGFILKASEVGSCSGWVC